jgi:hypothetical protein
VNQCDMNVEKSRLFSNEGESRNRLIDTAEKSYGEF